MSDKKLTQGTYYSCSHQKLSKNKCNSCETERERERERERAIWSRKPKLNGKDMKN